jgi:hypothetical protein
VLPDNFFNGLARVDLPPLTHIVKSPNQGMVVNPFGYSERTMRLIEFCRAQVLQDRRKYFIMFELYRRDTWIRATIDYITRRVTRDPNRLVDVADPMSPAVNELQDWLDVSFPDGDFLDLYGAWAQDLSIFRQAYSWIERTATGDPVALWPMDSRITFPVYDFSGAILFHAQVYNGQARFFNKEDVLYFPVRNNGANPVAIPTMETLYESAAMEMQANRYNRALFENNLNIGAVFSMPNASLEDVEESRRYLIDQYSGPENAYLPLVLSGDRKMLRDGAMAVKDINFEHCA